MNITTILASTLLTASYVSACPNGENWLISVNDLFDPNYLAAYPPGKTFQLPGLTLNCSSEHRNTEFSSIKAPPNLNESVLTVTCFNSQGEKFMWASRYVTELNPKSSPYSEDEKVKWSRQSEWLKDREDNQYFLLRDKQEKHSYRIDVRCVGPEIRQRALQLNN